MKQHRQLATILAFSALATLAISPWAQAESAAGDTATSSAASTSMTVGEIKKIDPDTGKITIKHGPIENLGMPGMTMVFKLKTPGLLGSIKAGDPVRFVAQKENGSLVVTQIEPNKP